MPLIWLVVTVLVGAFALICVLARWVPTLKPVVACMLAGGFVVAMFWMATKTSDVPQ